MDFKMHTTSFLILLTLILSFKSFGSREFKKIKLNQYKIFTGQTPDGFQGYFSIIKNGLTVFEEREFGSYYYIKMKDVNGDKKIDLIITQWTGGAHCCYNLTIFNLQNGVSKLAYIQGGSRGFQLKNLDQDESLEIIFWDNPIDYLFNSFSSSAQGKVILKLKNGKFRLAPKLMKSSINSKDVQRMRLEIRKEFQTDGEIPHSFLKLLMQLSYSGHLDFALRLAEELWPKSRAGFTKFKLDFSRALSGSVYWREFYLAI